MPGIIRLINQNPQRSVRAMYSYKNKSQMRSIILLWQRELGERINKYWIHAIPDIIIKPEKTINF